MESDENIVSQTGRWIRDVVVGCNFCPFAARELNRGSIYYQVLRKATLKHCLEALAAEFQRLDEQANIETTLLILPDDFADFNRFLELTEICEKLLADLGKEGIYQLASFHPEYLFAGSKSNDPANYTNRSLYPMLHILREASITKVLEHFANPERIPDNNIAFAKKKGLEFMKVLREACLQDTQAT